jgi:hypothetical protein
MIFFRSCRVRVRDIDMTTPFYFIGSSRRLIDCIVVPGVAIRISMVGYHTTIISMNLTRCFAATVSSRPLAICLKTSRVLH